MSCRQRRHLPHLLRPLLLLLYWNKRKKTDTMTFFSLIWSWFVLGLMCRLWCFQWSMVFILSLWNAPILFSSEGKGRAASRDSCRWGIKCGNIWQVFLELLFRSNKYKANLIANTCESRFGWFGVLRGTTRTTTLFQFRSWLNIFAVVSRRQLKPLPLQQRPLFHALETSREKCRAFHVSCEWCMDELILVPLAFFFNNQLFAG